jgi:hypothetical protein
MAELFQKDEDLFKSAPYVGAQILKILEVSEAGRLSIFDLAKKMKSQNISNVRNMYYGMLFLYSVDIIEFNEPYIILNDRN